MKTIISTICLSCILTISGPWVFASSDLTYADWIKQADQAFEEGSYARALQVYEKAAALPGLSEGEQNRLHFHIADTTWRNLASTQQIDPQAIQKQREALTTLAEKLQEAEPSARPPRLWAEIQESLGDSFWLSNQLRNWSQAWTHYEHALDWWAGSSEIEMARQHYQSIIFRAANPEPIQPRYRYGSWGNRIPIPYLENAVKLANKSEQSAEANYLLASAYSQQGGYIGMSQARVHFEQALADGSGTPWYDDALFQFAQWQQRYGASHYDDNGNWLVKPDYEAALKLYRQVLSEYKEGESRYWRQAKHQIEQITDRELAVLVHHNFLPSTAVRFDLRSRNLDGVEVEVFAVDPMVIIFPDTESSEETANWWERQSFEGDEAVFSWKSGQSFKQYEQHHSEVDIADGLDKGLYVIQAQGSGQSAYAWLLVTRAAVMTKSDNAGIYTWVVDAETGEPIEDASLLAWFSETKNNTRSWTSNETVSDEDGLAQISRTDDNSNRKYQLFVDTDEGPALLSQYWYTNRQRYDLWRVYAFTDRPAYRPGETAQWKFSARVRQSLSSYEVPANKVLNWRIVDPRGEEVAQGDATLNDYGSTWGELPLTDDMPLGMYRVEFRQSGKWIGGDNLFRLEEYKLPEFKVSVIATGSDGEAFRLGDRIEVAIQADYYFGGAVADAQVELVVYQKPFVQWWRPIRPYSFYYQGMRPGRGYYGPGQQVEQETLKTDEAGRATFTLETPAGNRQDLEYTVEARVVDESRREITGQTNIKVTRQPYFVYLEPERRLYRPGETASIEVKALNANGDAVKASGRIRVTREEWQEIWVGPKGEEITGQEYHRRQQSRGLFSRRFEPSEWRKLRDGYKVEEISSQGVSTDENGVAEVNFAIESVGYYKVAWFSKAEDGYPIKADAALWVADESSLDIGFHGGLSVIFDKASLRAGHKAPVMLSAPGQGGAVWFTVESDGLLKSQIIRMDGSVKLIQLEVTDAWIPNVFLAASLFQDYTLHQDTEQAIVPPAEQFLDVSIIPSASHYEPREKGTLTIETRDHGGDPVAAEVALSLFDEAVFYIQPMLAGDMREFFYGQKRGNAVRTASSTYDRLFWTPVMEAEHSRDETGKGTIDEEVELQRGARDNLESAEVDYFSAAASPMAKSLAFADGVQANVARRSMAAGESMAVEQAQPAVVVRSDFRATVFWKPNIITDASGRAEIEVTFPDSLTTWQAEARALALPGKVGQASTEMTTRLPLIARLQIPRFLVVGDTVTLSGVINNNTDESTEVLVTLEQEGSALQMNSPLQTVSVPAQGSTRVDFKTSAETPGESRLTLTAQSANHADAMELTLPVYAHGIDKFLAQSGKMLANELSVAFDMREFKPEGASFEIYATPSLASTMLDALPYLAEYPYGCVEQTMSRFLPAVIVANTLKDLGLKEEDVVERAFGGIEARNAGDGADALYDLKDMISKGLGRLYDMQHSNGGWGWWKGGNADVFMSAYVVWGMSLCQQADTDVQSGVLERGRDFLQKRLVETEGQHDLAAWVLHALTTRFKDSDNPTPTRAEAKAFAGLWKVRTQLNAYSRALLTLSAVHLGFGDEAAVLARNLENGVIVDDVPQGSILASGNLRNDAELATAHWGQDGLYYRWSQGGVESTAFAVKALLAAKGDRSLVDKAVNWLVQNRRGAQWSNTRDTAIVILALNDFLKESGDLEAGIDFEIMVNGERVASESIASGQGPLAPSRFKLDATKLKAGKNTIMFKRLSGDAPLYFSARANFFTLENPIEPAGNVIFVQRDFYRISPVPTLLDGYREDKQKIESGASVVSGDRVEVVLVVQAKNNLEYLIFEDLKAAGFEAVELQSGTPIYARQLRVQEDDAGQLRLPAEDAKGRYLGPQRWVYQELRDRKIATFVDKLPEGYWEIRTIFRAETPGTFSALPVLGHAMYVPEIRANSAEFKVEVTEEN